MASKMDKTKDGTITFTISIPWDEIQKSYTTTVDELVKHIEIKGFRKGKAPRDMAEKQLDPNKVYEEVIKKLIPVKYAASVKEHNVRPIMQPDIRLGKAKEGETWEVIVQTCEKPDFSFDTYKKLISEAKGEIKKDELWIPGKSDSKETDDGQTIQQKKQKQLNTVLEYLIKQVDMVIPHIMIAQEVDARLTRLVDEIGKLGLTIDTYAKSKGLSPDMIRGRYEQEVINTFKLEFILEELAEREHITIDEKEIDATIAKLSDAKERDELSKNKYYMATLMRRQKTLDKLLSL